MTCVLTGAAATKKKVSPGSSVSVGLGVLKLYKKKKIKRSVESMAGPASNQPGDFHLNVRCLSLRSGAPVSVCAMLTLPPLGWWGWVGLEGRLGDLSRVEMSHSACAPKRGRVAPHLTPALFGRWVAVVGVGLGRLVRLVAWRVLILVCLPSCPRPRATPPVPHHGGIATAHDCAFLAALRAGGQRPIFCVYSGCAAARYS